MKLHNCKIPKPVLVSACLLGIKCNYKSESASSWKSGLSSLFGRVGKSGILFIPICPEQLGGLPTPRIPAELQGSASLVLMGKARVLNKNGDEVSAQFLVGARESLRIARLYGARHAILKSKSPSCGIGQVYDGSFSGILVAGNGITAELFRQSHIKLIDDLSFLELLQNEQKLKDFFHLPSNQRD